MPAGDEGVGGYTGRQQPPARRHCTTSLPVAQPQKSEITGQRSETQRTEKRTPLVRGRVIRDRAPDRVCVEHPPPALKQVLPREDPAQRFLPLGLLLPGDFFR